MYIRNKNKDGRLIEYSDSDWAKDQTDRKIMSGRLILYKLKTSCMVIKEVALSTAEAEYMAAPVCAQDLEF